MDKVINEHGEHRHQARAEFQTRWNVRKRYLFSSILLASAIAAGGFYYLESPNYQRRAVPRSAAYDLGFANAALAGCSFRPGLALDQLAEAVQADAHGVVHEEIRVGFADFAELLEDDGPSSACKQAEGIFGPDAEMRPGVLLPR